MNVFASPVTRLSAIEAASGWLKRTRSSLLISKPFQSMARCFVSWFTVISLSWRVISP